MLKYSKLLRLLLAPIMFYAAGDDAGGGGSEVDRGDTLAAGAPDTSKEAEEDAAAELARIEAEKAAKEAEEAAAKGAKDGDKDEKDEKDEKEDKDEKDGKRKDTRVPLARHKELLEAERARREAVEAELAKFKGGEKVAKVNEDIAATETKLLEMETQYTKLMADGETEKAAKMMAEIRKAERTISDQKADMKAAAAEARAYERVRYDTVVERLEEAYPALNPDHDDFDKEMVKEVLELKEAYELKGLSPADAIQKATKILMKPATVKQEKATTVDPKVDPEEVAKQRKADAVKKSVETTTKQPAATDKTGLDSDKLGGTLTAKNAMKMPYEDFSKLTEDQLAKIRGDDL